MKFRSLSFRLLLSAGLILAVFFALVAIILEQGYRESAQQALKEKLQIQVYSILSAAELTRQGRLKMPASLPEPRFANPGSGLYAFIQGTDTKLLWRSPSAIGLEISPSPALKPGDTVFMRVDSGQFVLYYDVIWETESGRESEYVFSVVEDAHSIINQVTSFRNTLTRWLVVLGVLLVMVQFIVLRWSLKPLRIIVKDLEDIEQGAKPRLQGRYPSELQGLADNLNALISSERAHLERYRNTLADLAHSLKTPLAILRGSMESQSLPEQIQQTFDMQISRMNEIVEYQLQRAAAKGQKKIIGKVDVIPVIEKIIASLKKVHGQKHIQFVADMPERCLVYCEQGDLYEIAGNLLDNAAKWCEHQVKVRARTGDKAGSMELFIEDDGPGILPEQLDEILQRGVRADENIQGHGIGMAVVNELVSLLGGELTGRRSTALGGMQWQVRIP